jgi:8-oxo-dGTP diphosphatase
MPFANPHPPLEPDPGESCLGEGEPLIPSSVIPVVAAVIRRGDRCLLALRQAGKRHGGSWEFPGGKVGDGESERVALARELREELGVTLAEMGPCLFTAGDPGTPFRVRFWASRVEGEPQPLEHAEVRWVTPSEARALRLAPADARFLREGMGGWEDVDR